MKVFLLALIIIALCIFALSFNIIFRKNGQFPDGEIAHNKALRKQGIQCAKLEEKKLWGKKKYKGTGTECSDSDCASCGSSCIKE